YPVSPARRLDDPNQQFQRLLGRVPESLRRSRVKRRNVRPDISQRFAPLLIQISLQSRNSARTRLYYKARIIGFLHSLPGPTPDSGNAEKFICKIRAIGAWIDKASKLVQAAIGITLRIFSRRLGVKIVYVV